MYQLLFIEEDSQKSRHFLETIQQLPLELSLSKVPGPRRAWFFIEARIHVDAIIAPCTLTDIDLAELICFERDHNPHAQLILYGPAADAQRVNRLSAATCLSFDLQPEQLLDELSSVLNKKDVLINKPDLALPPVTKRWDPAVSVVMHIQSVPTEEQIPQIKSILDKITWQNHRTIRYRYQRYSLQLHNEEGAPSREEQLMIATRIQSELASIGLYPCYLLFSQPIFNREQCNNVYALMDYTMDYLITSDVRIAFMTPELLSQLISTLDIELPRTELLQAIRAGQREQALQITHRIQQKLHNVTMIPLQELRMLINDCLMSIYRLMDQRFATEIFADLAIVCRLDQWQSMLIYLEKWLDKLTDIPQNSIQTPSNVFTAHQILHVIDSISLADLSTEGIAKTLHRSPSYLNDVFKKEMRISLVKYIGLRRLNKAAELVRSSNRKIIDIAKEVGYDNYSYFCQVFRKHFSVSPVVYRTMNIESSDSDLRLIDSIGLPESETENE